MPDHTVVLNSTEWGGYLMWAYPDLDLVTHGYGDTFTDAEIQRNVDIFTLEPGWDDAGRGDRSDRWRSSGRRAPSAYALQQQGWEIVERDGDDVALLRAPG